MRYSHILIAGLIAITSTTACTQEQQQAISDLNLEKTVHEGIEKTEHTAASASDWLESETAIWSLRFKVQRAMGNENVSPEQIASLKNSLSYIEKLQKDSIESGDGITKSERAQIVAAADRVGKRLDGWLASTGESAVQ